MVKPQIIDNFLPKEMFDNIANTMLSENFSWYYCDGINSRNYFSLKNEFQFIHLFYCPVKKFCWNSDHGAMIFPLLDNLKVSALIKVKANLLTITPEIIQHGFHRDVEFLNSKTAIYYVNTNNGHTVFESGLKVKSVANRIVIFDSNELHAGTTCTDENCRVVINLNFF